jgi:hypothetical protein
MVVAIPLILAMDRVMLAATVPQLVLAALA